MGLLPDVRYAVRALTKSPSFSMAAVFTLALGIAANTIAFTLLNALVLRPLPVPAAHRVVRVFPIDATGRRHNLFSSADARDYRAQASGFDVLAAYIPSDVTIGRSSRDTADVAPRPAVAYVVSQGYFDLVGFRPALGRLLEAADERAGSVQAVVISYGTWKGRFASDPGILGETIAVNGRPFTIVGVGPSTFAGTEPLVPDLWVPTSAQPVVAPGEGSLEDRDIEWLLLVGRLSGGVTRRAAADGLSVIARRLAVAYPGERRPRDVEVVAGTFFTLDPGAKPVIAVVMGIVGLVLLIACANVANLMLARAASRQREIAVRLAIGAGRWNIVRGLLVETVLLGLVAGGVALLLSEWTLRVLYASGQKLAPYPWTLALNLTPDWRVFAYTFLLALAGGAVFGFIPALQASSLRIASALHEDAAILGLRLSRSRVRNGLVIAQISCSLVLLIAAALLTRGLQHARALDLGFTASGVLYAEYDLEKAGYTKERAAQFSQQLRERAGRIEGVAVTGLTSHVPLHGGVRRTEVQLADAGAGRHPSITALYTVASPEYFEVLGIPFAAGRNFNSDDLAGRASTAIISEGLARRFWPSENPLGRTLRVTASTAPVTVVGVARDASTASIWREKEMSIYLPAAAGTDERRLHLLVRTGSDPAAAASALRQIAATLDPDLRFEAVPLDKLLSLWLLPSRVAAAGATVLGLLALALASIGIYGVLAYVVAQRTREIGVRIALGASPAHVIHLILGEGSTLIAVGVVLGVAGAGAGAPLLRTLLLDVSTIDPLAFGAASLALTAVALCACYVPARRAARLPPLVALRGE
jgi:predicted permease